MAIKNNSSLLLPLLMVFALFFMPVISGEVIKICAFDCYSTAECSNSCIREGYIEGVCVQNAHGTGLECCCVVTFLDLKMVLPFLLWTIINKFSSTTYYLRSNIIENS
ncbi:unnamed protein product [Thlaspi arvense]|uniref:Defensin-like protein n=1 Tax=Thlaspi arvense TaxID=13288 RepID=A0AAU9RXK2_THLAR|nr:unnamed protein product [Thlaspi arvense]